MTWDDLEKARAERAAKEAKKAKTKAKRAAKKAAKEAKSAVPLKAEEPTAGKTQRGRKRKSAIEGEGADAPGSKAKAARAGEVQYRALQAKMY